ncbi:TPA: hypothetical protein HA278_05115 [Candidatus Woesearchaeota archaeon]|nr:hypothetical protein [Candidatus Woesearchaeota archaeon]
MTILYNETTDNISIQIKENTKSRWMCFDGKSAEQSVMWKEHPYRLALKYTQRMVEHIDTDKMSSVLVLGSCTK